ncbi:hypothetical protein M9Y10_002617 [Tritrichomonas musculus]|uniref:ANK_REP_REGION domain-containing protein n=1 Tax=Tritrichomonas musculus TaxID=1915356 RepID=A0ABR2LAB6_9EUKA
MTSLHAAANSGDLHRVKFLINRGTNIDTQTSDHWTALHRAVQKQHEDVVRFLIDNGADCNITNNAGQTPLHVACCNDNVLIVLLLVEGHAEINPKVFYFLFYDVQLNNLRIEFFIFVRNQV